MDDDLSIEPIALTPLVQRSIARFWHCLHCGPLGKPLTPIAYGKGERVFIEAQCEHCGKATRFEM